MKSGKTMRDIIVLMLMASLLAGCGSSPANSGGNTDAKEAAAAVETSEIEAESGEAAGSTESEIETESEETAVNKESILKEADVDISVADAGKRRAGRIHPVFQQYRIGSSVGLRW